MPIGAIAAGASALGSLAGGLGGKQQGQTAQNYYTPNLSDPRSNFDVGGLQNHIGQAMQNQPTYAGAQQDVQNNPALSQMFGSNGLMNQTGSQISDLMNNGFTLNNDDKTAYGQAAGNIARQFGQSQQGLSQSLADRGLSSSGVAGQQFSNSFGNKQEQLAGLQTQIAQNRMNMNLQRLNSAQQFMNQLGNQYQGAVGQAFNQKLQGNQQLYDLNKGMLDSMQGQANEAISQQNQGAHNSQAGNAMSGLMGGIGTANSMFGSGGMFGKNGAFESSSDKSGSDS